VTMSVSLNFAHFILFGIKNLQSLQNLFLSTEVIREETIKEAKILNSKKCIYVYIWTSLFRLFAEKLLAKLFFMFYVIGFPVVIHMNSEPIFHKDVIQSIFPCVFVQWHFVE